MRVYEKMKIPENDVIKFLANIESGTVRLEPQHEPQSVYAGNVSYKASNGWEIVIFDDANEWDYIDFIRTSDGREIDFDELELMPQVNNYEPSDEVAWSCYGMPGYCRFRCTNCGKEIKFPDDKIFLCLKCKKEEPK